MVAPLILLSAKVQIYFIPLNPNVFPIWYEYWTSTFGFGLFVLTTILKPSRILDFMKLMTLLVTCSWLLFWLLKWQIEFHLNLVLVRSHHYTAPLQPPPLGLKFMSQFQTLIYQRDVASPLPPLSCHQPWCGGGGYNKYKISQSSWAANWKLWLLVGKLEKDSIFTLSAFETILFVSKGVFIVQMLRGSCSNESIHNRCHYCSSSASLSLNRWMYRTLVRTVNNTGIIVSM